MRAKIANSAVKTQEQMQRALQQTISQSRELCFCLASYLRLYLKPRISLKNKRQKRLNGSLINIFIAKISSAVSEVKLAYQINFVHKTNEASLYWMHSKDPRKIKHSSI